MSTGAWFSPVEDPGGAPVLCTAGNVNVLTPDVGSSGLSQGCAGARALVEVQAFDGPAPPVASASPPAAHGR
jgi:biotin/methionine sulfoxide reductase